MFYSLVYTVLGSVALAAIPGLRVTLLNLVVFVLGAFAGGITFLHASSSAALQPLAKHYLVFIVFYFGAAIFGGTLLVWLKMRFLKTSNDSLIF